MFSRKKRKFKLQFMNLMSIGFLVCLHVHAVLVQFAAAIFGS